MPGARPFVATLAFLLAGCGSAAPVASGSVTPSPSVTASQMEQPTPSDQPSSSPEPSTSESPVAHPITNSPIPTANGWVTYINHKGELTFSAPATWRLISCEEDIGYVVAVADPPVGCGRDEYYSAWLFGVSLEGDQRSSVPPLAASYVSVATITGSQDVILAGGVHGIRYTALETRDGMIGEPKGTTQIYYLVYNGERTYAIATPDYRARPIDQLISIA